MSAIPILLLMLELRLLVPVSNSSYSGLSTRAFAVAENEFRGFRVCRAKEGAASGNELGLDAECCSSCSSSSPSYTDTLRHPATPRPSRLLPSRRVPQPVELETCATTRAFLRVLHLPLLDSRIRTRRPSQGKRRSSFFSVFYCHLLDGNHCYNWSTTNPGSHRSSPTSLRGRSGSGQGQHAPASRTPR